MPEREDPNPTRTPQHRLVDVPGGRIHVVEQGTGPLVLLVHGFPDGWYTWRHQLPALADAGFRAAAIDLRGYGRSAKPPAAHHYGMLAHVADNVAVVDALGERTAAVLGHDVGSPIASASALLRPDVFTAVGLLGVPHAPRALMRPSATFALAGGDEEFYVSYFQAPGRAEAEIEVDIRSWLRGFFTALSGRAQDEPSVFTIAPGGRMRDRLPSRDEPLPGWLSEDDLDVSAQEFERTGFTGALNRYRNMDRDWEDLAAWDGAVITQPALFVTGTEDATTVWMADAIQAHTTTLPGLRGSHLLDGVGHWPHRERPDEVNRLVIDWLRGCDP